MVSEALQKQIGAVSPLRGKRILVTRPTAQAHGLSDMLMELEAEPVILRSVEIAEPLDLCPFDQALRQVRDFHWVVFTSVNGVHAARRRMQKLGISSVALSQCKLAVVGPSTFEAVASSWRTPDAMPPQYEAEMLPDVMGDVMGRNILLLRADKATQSLPDRLASLGATVLDIVAYRTIPIQEPAEFGEGQRPDAITFTSGESAKASIANLREGGLGHWLEEVPIVCIGPVTAQALSSEGFAVTAVADPHTLQGVIAALSEILTRETALV